MVSRAQIADDSVKVAEEANVADGEEDFHFKPMPKVSVLLISHNYGRYLRAAIESILAQTYDDYEIVVAEDGSTDDSLDILAGYRSHLARIVSGPPVGMVANYSRAIPFCQGAYLALLDADDAWLPNRLAATVGVLERHSRAALAFGDAIVIDEAGSKRGTTYPSLPGEGIYEPAELYPRLLESCFMRVSAVTIRADCWRRVGGLPRLPCAEDWALWLTLARRWPIGYVGSEVACYRDHSESMTHRLSLTQVREGWLALYAREFSPDQRARLHKYYARVYLFVAGWRMAEASQVSDLRLGRWELAQARRLWPGVLLRSRYWLYLWATGSPRLYLALNQRLRPVYRELIRGRRWRAGHYQGRTPRP